MELVQARQQASAAVASIPASHRPMTLLGFDGFIDKIVDLVAARRSITEYSRIPTIAALAERLAAVAGLSTNIEPVVKQIKLGGNGPIMANALLAQTHGVRYVGNLGDGAPHPIFAGMVSRLDRLVNLGAVCETQALEFDDGKVMLTGSAPLNAITYARVLEACGGRDGLRALLADCRLVATVNWTQILGLTDIWLELADQVLPGLWAKRPLWFIDLADPAKRSADDLRRAIAAAQRLQQHADVVLGLNEEELRQVQLSLGIPWNHDLPELERAESGAKAVRAATGLSWIAVHFVATAACAGPQGSAATPGYYVAKPKITTGAGDHFNAGFCAALLAGLSPRDCLLAGTGTSGYYVRTAESPTRAALAGFMLAGELSESMAG